MNGRKERFLLSCRVSRHGKPQRTFVLKPGNAPNRGFSERQDVDVATPEGTGWYFVVDDERLELNPEGSWTWSPGFFAGTVAAELQRDSRVVARYVLDVSPDPSKLAIDTYGELVEQLREFDPMLLAGTEPASATIGMLGSEQDPWVEFRRLRIHGPEFITALDPVVRHPLRPFRATRQVVPLRIARRVDVYTVMAAAVNGTIGSLMGSDGGTSVYGEPQYDVPWYEEHFDGAANRSITALLLSVARRTQELRQRLEREVERAQKSKTRTDIEKRWPARREFLDGVSRTLAAVMAHDPFRSVTRPEITAAGLNAISSHPDYARAYSSGWKTIRSGLRGVDRSEVIWLRPTWELYERWCFIRVVHLIEDRATRTSTAKTNGATRAWHGCTDSGTEVSALLQPKFPAFDNASRTGFWSMSREREPDIVVTIKTADHRRFLVLDAKYRQSRFGVLESMASAHIYHDSLRWDGGCPDLALLLVPSGGGAPWLEETALMGQERIGVIVLRPDGAVEQLASLIDQLLDV